MQKSKVVGKLFLNYIAVDNGDKFLEYFINLKRAIDMCASIQHTKMLETILDEISNADIHSETDAEKGLSILRKYVRYEQVITISPRKDFIENVKKRNKKIEGVDING